MKRSRIGVFVVLTTVFSLAATACSDRRGVNSARAEAAPESRGGRSSEQPGDVVPAPDFTLSNVAGGSLKLSDFRGKVVLLDFWATWCGPCRAGIPHLNELYATHRKKGFEVIGISVDRGHPARTGLEVVRDFTTKIAIRYPLVMADAGVVGAYGRLPGAGGIRSIPTAFLVDRAGNVRKHYIGLQPKGTFERDLAPLLAEKAPESEGSL